MSIIIGMAIYWALITWLASLYFGWKIALAITGGTLAGVIVFMLVAHVIEEAGFKKWLKERERDVGGGTEEQ